MIKKASEGQECLKKAAEAPPCQEKYQRSVDPDKRPEDAPVLEVRVGRLMAGTPESTAVEKESPAHPEPKGVAASTFFRASRKKGCAGDGERTRFRRGELRAPR